MAEENNFLWKTIYSEFLTKNQGTSLNINFFSIYDIDKDNIPELICYSKKESEIEDEMKIFTLEKKEVKEVFSTETIDYDSFVIPHENEKSIYLSRSDENFYRSRDTQFFKIEAKQDQLFEINLFGEIKSHNDYELNDYLFYNQYFIKTKSVSEDIFFKSLKLGNPLVMLKNNKYNVSNITENKNVFLNGEINNPLIGITYLGLPEIQVFKILWSNGIAKTYDYVQGNVIILNLNGKYNLKMDIKYTDNSILVPVCSLCENLNLKIDWDSKNQIATIDNRIKINTKNNSKALLLNGTLYASVDYISDLLLLDYQKIDLEGRFSVIFLNSNKRFDNLYKYSVDTIIKNINSSDLNLNIVKLKEDGNIFYVFETDLGEYILVNKYNGQVFNKQNNAIMNYNISH